MAYTEIDFNFKYTTDLNMHYCGYREKQNKHCYGPAVREHFVIVYIREGEAVLTLKGKKPIHMHEGQILVMFPHELIYYKVLEDKGWSIQWIGIFGKVVYDFITPLGITPDSPVYDCPNPCRTNQIFDEIIVASGSRDLSGKILCISRIYELFASLGENMNIEERLIKDDSLLNNHADRRITYHSDNLIIRQAENYIRFNYDRELTIEQIAANVHLEPVYFARLFKKETGMPPKKMIVHYRIEKAKQLLETTDLSVKEISQCIGFRDSLYFSRMFTEKVKMSPTDYRKRHS